MIINRFRCAYHCEAAVLSVERKEAETVSINIPWSSHRVIRWRVPLPDSGASLREHYSSMASKQIAFAKPRFLGMPVLMQALAMYW